MLWVTKLSKFFCPIRLGVEMRRDVFMIRFFLLSKRRKRKWVPRSEHKNLKWTFLAILPQEQVLLLLQILFDVTNVQRLRKEHFWKRTFSKKRKKDQFNFTFNSLTNVVVWLLLWGLQIQSFLREGIFLKS